MNLFAVVVIIAICTAALAALIVHADLDLWAIEALQGLNRPRAPRPEASMPLEPAVVYSERSARPPRYEEMNEGERWLASMAAYAPATNAADPPPERRGNGIPLK